MPWVKLDDGFADHPKVYALSDKAFRVHVRALCYCGKHLTDGRVPAEHAAEITRGRKSILEELVNSGLWQQNGSADFHINDYLEYNPSRQAVEEERAKRRDAAKKAADARWHH